MDLGIVITAIVTAVVSIPTALLIDRWKRKPQLVYWSPHTFSFVFEDSTVHTQSITVRNAGGKKTTNVEIIHRRAPGAFSVHPAVPFTEVNRPTGEHIIQFQSLGPKEIFTVEYLDFQEVPELLNIRSEDGQATFQAMELSEKAGPVAVTLGVLLFFVGFVFSIYWIVKAVIFISQQIL